MVVVVAVAVAVAVIVVVVVVAGGGGGGGGGVLVLVAVVFALKSSLMFQASWSNTGHSTSFVFLIKHKTIKTPTRNTQKSREREGNPI